MGVKISALPSAGSLTGTEVVPLVKSGITSQTTAQAIANLNAGVSLGSITTNILPAAGATYSLGGLSLSWLKVTADGVFKSNGVTMYDITNNRINDNSGNPSIYVDSKILRTGTHGSPVNRYDWGNGVFYTSNGGTIMTIGVSALSLNMNVTMMVNCNITGNLTAVGTGNITGNLTTSGHILTTVTNKNLGSVANPFFEVHGAAYYGIDAGAGQLNIVMAGVSGTTPSGKAVKASVFQSSAGASGLAIYTANGTASHNIYLETGNASAGDSADINVTPGTATGTVGGLNLSGNALCTFKVPKTITAGGTLGDRTINKISGSVNFDTAATTLMVTNSLVGPNSLVFAQVRNNDAAAFVKNCSVTTGAFVITLGAPAAAETPVGFFVTN